MLNSSLLKNRLKNLRMQTQLFVGEVMSNYFDSFTFRRNRLTCLARH